MKKMKFLKFIWVFVLGFWILALLPSPSFAQSLGCGEGFGIVSKFLCDGGDTVTNDPEKVGSGLNQVIGNIIGFMTIIAGLWFMIQFIIGGYTWINAGGDKQRVQTAWSKIHQALLGLTIVVAAWVIVGLFGEILGLQILDPGSVIQNLKLK